MQNLSGFVFATARPSDVTTGSGDSRYCGVRCETATRVAKLAPNTERLTGSVAPASKDEGLSFSLGKARFVHQKAIH